MTTKISIDCKKLINEIRGYKYIKEDEKMPCKGKCVVNLKEVQLDRIINELRCAVMEGQCHQYILGLVITIELLREE